MRLNKLILALFVMLTVVSCRKDDVSDPTTTPTVGPFEVLHTYTVDVQGIVKNPDGQVISDAIINVDGQQVRSSEDGLFSVEKLKAPQTGLYINADAEGYFEGGTSIYAYENQVYQVQITLIPFDNYIEFDSGTGLDFVAEDGTKVSIPADGIVDEAGNAYSGPVDFYSYWLDPTSENLAELAPGSLVGQQDDELVALKSFGMIAVELIGDAGQDLNLASDTKAQLSFPVPNEMSSSANTEIDLWHFNEQSGRWDLEGMATLVDGVYQAEVSHFSWWNCDVPFNSVFFCFNVVDSFDDPVGNLTLSVFVDGFGFASANIGPTGTYCDLVPVGQDMEVTLSTHCGAVLLDQVIQAVSGEEEVEMVVPLGSGEIDLVNISGTVSCGEEDLVTNGYAVVEIGGETYFDYIDEQGNYEMTVINCQGQDYEATLTGYNLDDLTGGVEEIIIGTEDLTIDIDACEEDFSQEVFMMNGDGQTITLFQCQANISVAEVTIIAQDPTGASGDYVILGVVGFDEGSFNGNIVSNTLSGTFLGSELNATSITIDHYSDIPGEAITGSFIQGNEITGSFVAVVQ